MLVFIIALNISYTDKEVAVSSALLFNSLSSKTPSYRYLHSSGLSHVHANVKSVSLNVKQETPTCALPKQ